MTSSYVSIVTNDDGSPDERAAEFVVTRTNAADRRSAANVRFVVHLLLVAAFVATLLSALEISRHYFGHSGITDHAIIGFVVLAFIAVHLVQRRHTVKRLLATLTHQTKNSASSRRATSDLILWLLTLNVMLSGTVDFVIGHETLLPIPGPFLFQKWHGFSAIVLFVYVTVHVIRRRKRFRTSRIR
jgi:hypothetical protein